MTEIPITLMEIKIKSEKDDFITKMKKQIRFKEKVKISGSNAFSLRNNVLMHTERIVISASLQKCMLKEFHVGHSGISRIKSFMRYYMYWPKID